MHKIASDWKRFYEDDPIVDRPIVELTTLELKNWARNKIISCKLSKKIYYNMAVIIRQSLDYLVELGELPTNPYANFKIKASLFTPVVQRGFSCEAEDYIFVYRGSRITSQAIDKKYERYCKELGFVKKGNHKTRKTCLTKIADNPNINLKDAMHFSGHKDIQTYIKHYCFSRYSDEQKRNELEKMLNV